MTIDKNKFGILGYGFVGKATHLGLLKNQQIAIHDPILGTKREDLKTSEYIFICIPTANDSDMSMLLDEVCILKDLNPNTRIVIRSTVPVGQCALIEKTISDKIIYIPEFLRERLWDSDCFRRPLIVGHDLETLPDWLVDESIIECSHSEAEVLKMFNNNYACLRVVFANQIYELSKIVGADYDKVLEMYNSVKDEQHYLTVNDELRGFGGKCLPKDLDFIISTFEKLNLEQTLFDSLKQDNQLWPITVRKS